MVYRSFGISCTQEAIWPQIGRPAADGERVARTFLLCQDAQRRGLSAVIVRAMKPWRLLENCGDDDVRVILNHRLRKSGPAGHYSVLVGIESEGAILHDPQLGANRRISQGDLMELWQPDPAAQESKGNILLAICRRPVPVEDVTCMVCGKALPPVRRCPLCDGTIPLHPAAIFGCADDQCPACLWDIVFCPACDYGFR
jgi:hypothetical protein